MASQVCQSQWGDMVGIEESQKVHVKDVKSDPVKMWSKLKAVHVQQKPGARFNAYETLLGVRKHNEESLSDLMGRAERPSRASKHYALPHSLSMTRQQATLYGPHLCSSL
jgi:hypothetical protein